MLQKLSKSEFQDDSAPECAIITLILEVKARSTILPEDIEQCLLYLHQGGYRLCLLVNFGEKPLGVRRFVHTVAADREKRGTDEKRETERREIDECSEV